MNTTVLMSSARYFSLDKPINPYYQDESVSVEIAISEHTRLHKTLEKVGITVHQVDAPPDSQDGVYTANWALVRANKAILARLPDVRKAEEAWADKILRANGLEVIPVPEDWRFSGQGDALACGDYLFCGQGYRSDYRAQKFAADTLSYRLVQLQTVPLLDSEGTPVINKESGWEDSFYYDIDLALAVIRSPSESQPGLIAFCKEAFTKESVATLLALSDEFDFIFVSEKEAKDSFACNLVSTGEVVVMGDTAPELQAALEAKGLDVRTESVTELAKGGGFIRCQTLSFND